MERMCRICLEPGAELPIFAREEDVKCSSVRMKISACLQEEVDDLEGYPANICQLCDSTMDVILNFIRRYKESRRTLENALKTKVEEAWVEASSESELTLAEVKLELDVEPVGDGGCEEPFGEINATKIRVKKEKKIKKKGRLKEDSLRARACAVTTSLLEAAYVWSGDHWRLSGEPTARTEAAARPEGARRVRAVLEPQRRRRRRAAAAAAASSLCDLCGAVFATQAKLTNHRKSHVAATLACPAPGCTKLCNSRHNLARHRARCHGPASARRHACAACGKRFAFRAELTHHAKRHEPARYPRRTYSCSHCGKTYKTRKSVDIHERSAHTGERPATCGECGAAFYHEAYLREHVRLHSGETPFACPVCSRGYAQRGNMKSHLRSHRLADLDARALAAIPHNYLKLLKT